MTKDNKKEEKSFWEIHSIDKNLPLEVAWRETDLDPELIEQKLMEDSRSQIDAQLKTTIVGYPKEKWSKKMQDFYKSLPSDIDENGLHRELHWSLVTEMERRRCKELADRKLANPEEEVLCRRHPHDAFTIEEIDNKLVVKCPRDDCRYNPGGGRWDEEYIFTDRGKVKKEK